MRLSKPACLVLFGILCALPGRAQAQELLDMYRTARVQAQAARASGLRLPPLTPLRLALASDSLFAADEAVVSVAVSQAPEPPNPFLGAEWESTTRLRRASFEREFGGTKWAYLGGTTLAWMDTVWTRELRARLETRFGRPTRTLIDFYREEGDSLDEFIQFQYWLTLNDSIPVLVMDTGGPFERSIVLASDERYRPVLSQIRAALSAELTRSDELETYADYFYDREARIWYQTGYDGTRYYTERAGPPILPRRRPGRTLQ